MKRAFLAILVLGLGSCPLLPLGSLGVGSSTLEFTSRGAGSVVWWLREADGVSHLLDGDPVQEGDVVQLAYCGPAGWLRLLGMDGTLDVRDYGGWWTDGGCHESAPFALELDGAPGPEHFWLEWSSREQAEDTGWSPFGEVIDRDIPWPPEPAEGVRVLGPHSFEKLIPDHNDRGDTAAPPVESDTGWDSRW